MPRKFNRSIFILTCLLLTGCSLNLESERTATARPPLITATLPPTSTPRPSETAPAPPPPPTITAVAGVTSTSLNVRAEPSTASEVIGIIAADNAVQITGKDIGGNWWQIVYESGADGKGWVTAQFVETGDSSQIPVIGGDESNPLSGNSAIIIQQLNVRGGPATSFDSFGILNANDVVNLTGKNRNGSWLQIDFPAGPQGKGWISSGFVKTDTTVSLPIVSDAGEVIGTGTPTDIPLPPTPTLVPAPMDLDTAKSPIKTVILGGTGPHTVLYNGDVSFPEGDTEDWILVTPQEDVVFVAAECMGSEFIIIEIIGIKVDILCNGNMQAVSVPVNVPFLIHIQATSPVNQLQYTNYILSIKASP